MTWNQSDLSRRSPWTKADIRHARQVALKPVLEQLGYQLEPLKNGNYIIAGTTPEIIVKEHYWTQTTTGVAGPSTELRAGNAIDFLVKIRGVTFNQAMQLLREPGAS